MICGNARIAPTVDKPPTHRAVSYTHLDVYKRQEISYTAIGKTVIRPDRAHPWRTFMPYGLCSVQASFAPPSPFTARPVQTFLVPPFQNILLEVQ